MNDTAFFTVVYPGVEPYLPAFLHSLVKQSCEGFDLIIGNDGLKDLDLNGYPLSFRIVDLDGSPAKNREVGLQFLRCRNYKQVIFGDSDDFFSTNRVEMSLRLLNDYDVVVNDLDLVNESGEVLKAGYLSRRLRDGQDISADYIRDKNVFGLSNTAVRGSYLLGGEIPANLVAPDWFIFATLLEKGARATFTASARTYYRQHGANIGALNRSSEKMIQAVKVKALHFEAMANAGFEFYMEFATAFRNLYQRLLDDDVFKARYLGLFKTDINDFPFWWEEAQLPEEQI